MDSNSDLPSEISDRPPPRKIHALLWQGLRSAFLRRPDWSDLPCGPITIARLMVLAILVRVLFDRLYIVGQATFYWQAALADWFDVAVTIWICWILVPDPRETSSRVPASVAALFTMFAAQTLVFEVIVGLVYVPLFRNVEFLRHVGLFRNASFLTTSLLSWAVGICISIWYSAAQFGLVWRSGMDRIRPRLLASALLIACVGLEYADSRAQYWYPAEPLGATSYERPSFRLTQEALELQPQILQRKLQDIGPAQPGAVHFYAIAFAPYAREDVFRREADLVAGVMRERFDAEGRTIELVNNQGTIGEWPWATPLNLKRTIDRVAQVMDRDKDILFIHLTSHGAQNGELAADFWPLQFDAVTAPMLKAWLDEAGVRYRVISVSACYSGSWIEPLSGTDSLVMTAADATHTSYGCGSKSDLTYFGRAMYDEQLRHTWSFEKAHAAARTIIEQREREAGKDDGFSNPQIRVGAGIRQRLEQFELERSGRG